MNVVILNYEYPPLGGGAGYASKRLAQGLARAGIDVDVLTAGSRGQDFGTHDQNHPDGVTVDRVVAPRTGIHQGGVLGAGVFLFRAMFRLSEKIKAQRYDFAIIFFSLPTGVLLPLLRRHNIPSVVSLRGSDVPGYDTRKQLLRMFHVILKPLTRWIWTRADKVIVVCDSLGKLARTTQPGLDYAVIGNGIDKNLFRPPKEINVARRPPLRCLAVSRLIRRKGLDTLIRAFELLPRRQYLLEIAGDGEEAESLRKMAEDLGIMDEVIFLGAISQANLPAVYQRADLFTLVPHEEAFGNVFAEAIACGLPVIASDTGGVRDLVTNEKNGLLIAAGDPQQLANAIQRLSENPAERERMAAVSRELAQKLLTWEDVSKCYLQVCSQIIENREMLPAK